MSDEENLILGEDEQIGDYLRRVRETRGLEIDQMAKAIYLQKNILQAIEENRWEEFPTEAYLRSYISAMCGKLSIDRNIVLKKFSADRNSQFAVAQISLAEEKKRDSKPSSTSTIGIIVILLIIATLFFVSKYLGKDSGEEPALEAPPTFENEEEEEESISDTLDKSNSAINEIAAIDTVIPKSPSRTQDTIRFECIHSATDRTCGISLRGLDAKMFYFTRETRRIINHSEASLITVTVPMRTKLFLNGAQIDYGRHNTLLFQKGQIIERRNRELR
ncbi:MAG: helix-turn-helix domain-containing protein [Fibromonadales bacterium]|nr:helix-turn-helix domain-containing protein [Fibromonadales bacterium]